MQREGPVKRKTEIGVSLIHVQGYLGLLAAERSREGCPMAFRGSKALPTSSWQTSGLQTPERRHTNTLFHPTPQMERDNRHI